MLELKTTEGFGTTIDVILVNGELKTGDRMVLCGLNGPIVREIRVLLTPEPLREIRTKVEIELNLVQLYKKYSNKGSNGNKDLSSRTR